MGGGNIKKYVFTNQDLIQMQQRTFEKKIMVTQAKLLEFCLKSNWNVSISFSGGADSSVLLDILCNFWKYNKEEHNNSKLLVLYANTSNEFASMPKFVKEYCKFMGKKHDIEIDLKIVRGSQNYVDVCRTIGYPVVSKKVARMVRDVREFLSNNNINYDDIKHNIDNGIESADYLRSLGFSKQVVLRLTGITSENHVSKSWSIPKKWRKLIVAPFNVSEKCCDILKKEPMKLIQKSVKANPIFGTLAEDSEQRRESYLQTGCVAFKGNKGQCTPLGFWLRQDILKYIDKIIIPSAKLLEEILTDIIGEEFVPIAPPYGELIKDENGIYEFTKEHNTGCKLCLFGCHLEKEPNRIQRLKEIEPSSYNFAVKSIEDGGLGYKEVMEYCGMRLND